jgi:putative addiction module killer protein
MIEVLETEALSEWFASLRDRSGRNRIEARIVRLRNGNMGDVAPVGEGVSGLRIHHGPGYRVYFVHRGKALVILLGGGDKASQSRDIATAKKLAQTL